MRNRILTVVIIVLIVSVYYNYKLGHSPIPSSKAQEVSFEQKQECAVYKKQIEDKFERDNSIAGGPIGYYDSFENIFYSLKQNSCLYVYSSQFGLKASDRYRDLYLVDALSGAVLTQATVIAECKFMGDVQASFYERVRSYETN